MLKLLISSDEVNSCDVTVAVDAIEGVFSSRQVKQ